MDKKILILILVGVLVFSLNSENLQKQAVGNLEGQACAEASDCPCWGEYNITQINNSESQGLGIGQCIEKECDMTYCVDVKPVGTWLKDNPWQYLRTHELFLFTLVAILIVWALWPKV